MPPPPSHKVTNEVRSSEVPIKPPPSKPIPIPKKDKKRTFITFTQESEEAAEREALEEERKYG
jgi:hypothetical protein